MTPPIAQSVGFGQLNCRRLWGRDDAVHDGFMELVSCLNRLSLHVVCVQETQAPDMGSLPTDQPFRYDGPLGSYGREAGFLFHVSIESTSIAGIQDSQSLRWRLVAGAVCVCSFYAPHVGIAVDVRVAFWRALAVSVQRVSQCHSRCPLLLAGDSNIWFPAFQLGRSRCADMALLPIVEEMMDSHGLVLRNPVDQPTHRCGAALDVILTTSTLVCQVTVHHGSGCCPVAPLCCPLLASDHMLCSCPLYLPQASVAAPVNPPTLPHVRDWSVVLASGQPRLAVWHQSVVTASRSHSRDIPGRAAVLESLFGVFTRILSDCASVAALPRSSGSRVCSRRRQPRWWNDACYHALIARNGSWRDLRRSGSEDDRVRFHHMRRQFHSIIRSSRASFWDDWLSTVQSLSHRDPRLASSHIRRTFRSSAASPDLCNMQWSGSDHRSVLSARDAQAQWRTHFASSRESTEFCDDFFTSISRRFATLSCLQDHGRFDAPFSYNELVAALSKCHESAPGADGLPYSVFKVHFPWWRHMLLSFFNLILQWAVVPSVWKSSLVVPLLKRDGDPCSHDSYRPISLASCAFKVFEHLVHARIAPHIFSQLDECQGGFRWGADVMAYSLLDSLRLRRHVQTFVAFVDIRKAFDSCWVEATLVRLHDVGVTGRLWHLISNFLCGTLSQVRVGDSSSQPWVDTGIAQGRVLSPLLFNLLVDSLAAAIRSAVPGVRLMVSDPFRLVCQLYADDLVILADSPADLQAALSAVYAWGTCWRFTFGIGPNKSAMVFGPTRGRTPCLVHLGGVPLPIVLQYRYLGIVLTPCLSWRAHVAYLCARGDRLFHQSSAWCHGEGLPVTFALSVFIAYVLSSASFGLEYIGDDPAALLQFNLSLRRWCRQLLGWPRASPVAAVHWELGIGDALRLVYGRAFSLFGRLSAMVQNGPRSPLPSSIFRLCSNEQGTWAHWCTSAFRSLSVSHPGDFGISPGSPPSSVSRWFSREVGTRLDHDLHLRLMAMAYDLHGVRVDLATSHFSSAQHNPIYSRSLPFAWSRSWGLARWGHDPSSTGRSARHQNRPVACPLCLADDGSLAHHLSVCPCHSAARDLWAHSCGFDVTEAATWAAHPLLFNPQHEANTLQTVRAHVRFVGHVCSRLERPRW